MGIRHVVTRGDTLWGLSGRYLGNFNRWPEIQAFHNDYVQKKACGRRDLIAIQDPNLIYVGQMLMIPGRDLRPATATVPNSPQASPNAIATPIELKVVYIIAPDQSSTAAAPVSSNRMGASDDFPVPLDLKAEHKAPISYQPLVTPDFTMLSELSGKIALENLNPERHHDNWELAVSGDNNTIRRKIKHVYDRAFLELTADMDMSFNPGSGMATVRPRIAAKAGIGAYTIKVEQQGSPNHFSYTLDLKPIEGTFDLEGRKFRYASQLSIKIDITVHPLPKGEPEPTKDFKVKPFSELTKVQIAELLILSIILSISCRVLPKSVTGTSGIPITHRINPADSKMGS